MPCPNGPRPAGLEIVEVDTVAGLEAWAAVFCTAFEIPEWAGAAWVQSCRRLAGEARPWRHTVAYLDGRPSGIALLFRHGEIAGIYGMGTIPAARRRGIGAALTLDALRAAREGGGRLGILHATDEGLPPYHALGFRRECTVGRFLWGL